MAVSLAVGYIGYKWKRRMRGQLHLRGENDISHFETLMPKIQLDEMRKKVLSEELCSVCLLELN